MKSKKKAEQIKLESWVDKRTREGNGKKVIYIYIYCLTGSKQKIKYQNWQLRTVKGIHKGGVKKNSKELKRNISGEYSFKSIWKCIKNTKWKTKMRTCHKCKNQEENKDQ